MKYLHKKFQTLSISKQLLLQVSLTTIVINIFLLCILNFNFFLISYQGYKDLVNKYEINQVDEMAYVSESMESSAMYLKEEYMDLMRMISNFYYNFGRISSAYGNLNSTKTEKITSFSKYPNNTLKEFKTLIIYDNSSNTNESNFKSNFDKSTKIITAMNPILKAIKEMNIFTRRNKNESLLFYKSLMIIDYKNNITYQHYLNDEYFRDSKKFNFSEKMLFFNNKYKETKNQINNIKKFSNMNVKVSFYDDDYLLRNNPLHYFDLSDNSYFNTSINQINYFVISNKLTGNINISIENYTKNLESGVFSIVENKFMQSISDEIINSYIGDDIILTESRYPYKVISPMFCRILQFKKKYNISDIKSSLSYDLSDCFSEEDKQVFFKEMNLSYNTDEIPIVNITQVLLKKLKINNDSYKVKKTLFPLVTSSKLRNFNYYYPTVTLFYAFYFKREEKLSIIQTTIYYKMILLILKNFFLTNFSFLLITIYTIYLMFRTMKNIDKPLDLMKNLIKSISILDDFKKKKWELEDYQHEYSDEKIEEIEEIPTMILDLIEGKLLQDSKKKNELIDMNHLQMIKHNNYILFEDNINEKIERSSYLNEILSVDIKEILDDAEFNSLDGEIINIFKRSCDRTASGISHVSNNLNYISKTFSEDKFKIGDFHHENKLLQETMSQISKLEITENKPNIFYEPFQKQNLIIN